MGASQTQLRLYLGCRLTSSDTSETEKREGERRRLVRTHTRNGRRGELRQEMRSWRSDTPDRDPPAPSETQRDPV